MNHDLNDYIPATPYWEDHIAALKEQNRRMDIVNKFLKDIGYNPENQNCG